MIAKLDHVAIMVSNMERSIQFYTEHFGFKVRVKGKSEKREMAFLEHETGENVEIELIREINPVGEYLHNGKVNHIAFSVEDVEPMIKVLDDRGIEFKSSRRYSTLEDRKMILLYGPDNELIQLIENVK